MAWRVIRDFADLKDGGFVYHAGENYPRVGDAQPERAAELSGRNNARGCPLIEDKPKRGRKKAEE